MGVADASGFFTYQNVDYKLLQFHFHTPSEHRLDDALSKAEVHLVHQSAAVILRSPPQIGPRDASSSAAP